jgi:AcrR family transcriptional regulator
MVQKDTAAPARPRGRPRSFDPDQVLNAARDAFWRNGYAATSLDDLAAATGLNRPSLYGAFGDKHALYLAALRRSRDEMLASQARALAVQAPLREVLTLIYSTASAIYMAGEEGPRGCFLIGTAVTESRTDPEVGAILDEAFEKMDAAFAARFAADAGELAPAADPAAMGQTATAVLHTLSVRARAGAGEAALRGVYEAGVAAICGPAKAP